MGTRNERQGSSAHCFVDDIADEIYQSVDEGDTAWHAGNGDARERAFGSRYVEVQAEVGRLLGAGGSGRVDSTSWSAP